MYRRVSQRERINQKQRTRAALVEAARRLLDQGRTPTVAEVADEALVSRATAYRYFPSQEHVLLEAVLRRSVDELDRAVTAAADSDQVEERVDGLIRATHAEIASNETGFRHMLSLSLKASRSSDGPTVAAIRGERRVHWIERAVAPLRHSLDDRAYVRLVSALALCLGAEAYFALRDLRGLDEDEIGATLGWAGRALVAAAIKEAGTTARREEALGRRAES
jgi:AcrR family transcriptional regulator